MGSRSFLSLQMRHLAQTKDVSECHMHWALQGARGRTILDKKINGCGLVHCQQHLIQATQ